MLSCVLAEYISIGNHAYTLKYVTALSSTTILLKQNPCQPTCQYKKAPTGWA